MVQLAILLLTARALGEVAVRLRQPAVVGEILAGVLLGPSLLSGLIPGLGQWILPQTPNQAVLREIVGLFGTLALLLITGLAIDPALIRRSARTAVGLSAGGLVVPFVTGFALGQLLPDDFLAGGHSRLIFSLFVATAMSISAIPVIAKILLDLDLMRREFGQTVLAAAMLDDTVGWILLSVIAGMARGRGDEAGTLLQAVGTILVFLALSFTAGRWLVRRALDQVRDRLVSPHRMLTLVVLLALGGGAITQGLNFEPLFGAFVAGIVLGRIPGLPSEVRRTLEALTLGVLAPIFFAIAGLKVDVSRLLHPGPAIAAFVFLAVATVGKCLGGYLGARLVGKRDHWTSIAFGAALNARGAIEIIIATIGLSLGILGQDMYSIVVLTAVATSVMAPWGVKSALARVEMDAGESSRLRHEDFTERSSVGGIHRVLIPVGTGHDEASGNARIVGWLLRRLDRRTHISVTLMTVSEPGDASKEAPLLSAIAEQLDPRDVVRKAVESENAVAAVLAEARKDYDLIVLNAPGHATAEAVFAPWVDSVVKRAPCSTIVFRAGGGRSDSSPQRILVPMNGTVAARRAVELALSLACRQEHVRVVNVVADDASAADGGAADVERRRDAAWEMVEEVRQLGESLGVHVEPDVRVGGQPEVVILQVAGEEASDLIVLGAQIRSRSARLQFGRRVERMLENAPCHVMVVHPVGRQTEFSGVR